MPTNNNHIKIIANNKKASFNYFLDEFFECGLVLKGTEIKSLRAHNPAISDSYAIIRNNEAFIINMNIPVYETFHPRASKTYNDYIDKLNQPMLKINEKGIFQWEKQKE